VRETKILVEKTQGEDGETKVEIHKEEEEEEEEQQQQQQQQQQLGEEGE
jgi:hypothetical protein